MVEYIIRLDDACPTMDSKKWDMYEKVFDECDIKPIVAVIPNNQDNDMLYEEEDKEFWSKVKRWQEKGWHIALHGYDHRYLTNKSGLVPINKTSEFAGVSLEEQINKIKKAWAIFKKYGIKSDIWIAPAHAFDENTIKALKAETTISIISDGFAFKPFNKYEMFWIPQQLWKFKKKNISGVYTICYHPNITTKEDIIKELNIIKENKNFIISDIYKLKEIYKNRELSLFDKWYEKLFFLNRKFRKIVKVIIFWDLIKGLRNNAK